MNIGFESKEINQTIKEFNDVFAEDQWFINLVDIMKELQGKGINFTDILIKENSIPYLGILKSFHPLNIFLNFFDIKNKFKSNWRISKEQIRSFVSKVAKKDLNIDEMKVVDLSLAVYGIGVFRINYSRSLEQDVLNVRYLDFVIPSLDKMKYPSFYRSLLEGLCSTSQLVFESDGINQKILAHRVVSNSGLIIHNGATGSGKTTSIAAEIGFLENYINGLIVTYEEPVEYRFINNAKVLQFEIGTDIKREQIIRHALRNTPSVISVGEVRTVEEIENLLDLASRGHLVFATLHTGNVDETLKLFSSLSNDAIRLFAQSIMAIVSHKLVVNKRGNIVPLYEILTPDDRLRNFLMEIKDTNKFRQIINQLYIDGTYSDIFVSFKKNLYTRVKESLLTQEEVKTIMKHNSNIIKEK